MSAPEAQFNLKGKVAVVTGASSGLGVALAEGLADAGADVAIGARRAEKLESTRAAVERRGVGCVAVPTDVADPAASQALVDAAVDRFGRVDILVNNAGVATAAPAS